MLSLQEDIVNAVFNNHQRSSTPIVHRLNHIIDLDQLNVDRPFPVLNRNCRFRRVVVVDRVVCWWVLIRCWCWCWRATLLRNLKHYSITSESSNWTEKPDSFVNEVRVQCELRARLVSLTSGKDDWQHIPSSWCTESSYMYAWAQVYVDTLNCYIKNSLYSFTCL